MSKFNKTQLDANEEPLVPGALYAERYIDEYGAGIDGSGRLVWYCADGCFYDSDSDEQVYLAGDDVLRQNNPINSAYASGE